MIVLIDPVSDLVTRLHDALPEADLHHVSDLAAGERALDERDVSVVILGPALDADQAMDAAAKFSEQHPLVSIVLATMLDDPSLYRRAMRAGVMDVLPWSADRDELRDILQRASAARERLAAAEAEDQRPTVGTTVATFSTKGGCGKSFVATNVATVLAHRHPGEVVLVDLDLQAGDVSIMLQLLPERGIQEAAELEEGLDDQALAGFLTPAGALKVLAAPAHPVHAEAVTADSVVRVLGLLRTMFRYVIIDGPPSFTDQMLAALDQVDTVLVVSSLDVPSIKNLKLSVDTLKELGMPRDRLKLVLNRADSKVGLTVREVERSLGTSIDVTLPSSREVPFAVNQGIAIVNARPKAPVSKALREAVQVIFGPSQARTEPRSSTSDASKSRRRGRRS